MEILLILRLCSGYLFYDCIIALSLHNSGSDILGRFGWVALQLYIIAGLFAVFVLFVRFGRVAL